MSTVPLSPIFRPVSFSDLPGWKDDNHLQAFEAFRRSAFYVQMKPYRSGSLGAAFESFAVAYNDSRETPVSNGAEARDFFERHFAPALVLQDRADHGFVTGFYEPVVEASRVRAEGFTVPLLSRPEDLVDIDEANRPTGMDPYLAFGRAREHGPIEYFDRQAIESGALADRGLEIAWLASRVDAFFIHVQGAAQLQMTDGTSRRVTYAAKSGQRFTGVGKVLADLGEIPLEQVTMQSIRAWLAAHPDRQDEILWRNRSYIFFREAPVEDPDLVRLQQPRCPLRPVDRWRWIGCCIRSGRRSISMRRH
jgi:membrane-bound lytic murein transglycosylase A